MHARTYIPAAYIYTHTNMQAYTNIPAGACRSESWFLPSSFFLFFFYTHTYQLGLAAVNLGFCLPRDVRELALEVLAMHRVQAHLPEKK
jgi:hypothetical protein